MTVDPSAVTQITGFHDVPDFAKGHVRDLRVRWALEEIGRPYRATLFDVFHPRPDAYLEWQPFGQVPAFSDHHVRLFESGAILLYLGEQDERLMPREPQPRWEATAWSTAALNSVEPAVMFVAMIDLFHKDKPWAAQARPEFQKLLEQRLTSLAEALDDKEWLAGRFTVADILMVTVLRDIRDADLMARFANLIAYRQRGENRPAFQRALADQLAACANTEGAQS